VQSSIDENTKNRERNSERGGAIDRGNF